MSELVRAALAAVVEGGTLSMDDARAAMGSVMDGEATPAQLAALLVALRMRGETVEELAGFAAAMRERVLRVAAPEGTIDTCGTGGDGSGTFNISTTAALVVAAAGVPVAKHGNRAMTSRSGSADVLEALGVRTDHDAASAATALREDGFAFLFAPGFHPAMKHAGPTRREIGVRTAFNLIGPLTNPAGARRQVIGVADPAAAPRLADVAAPARRRARVRRARRRVGRAAARRVGGAVRRDARGRRATDGRSAIGRPRHGDDRRAGGRDARRERPAGRGRARRGARPAPRCRAAQRRCRARRRRPCGRPPRGRRARPRRRSIPARRRRSWPGCARAEPRPAPEPVA